MPATKAALLSPSPPYTAHRELMTKGRLLCEATQASTGVETPAPAADWSAPLPVTFINRILSSAAGFSSNAVPVPVGVDVVSWLLQPAVKARMQATPAMLQDHTELVSRGGLLLDAVLVCGAGVTGTPRPVLPLTAPLPVATVHAMIMMATGISLGAAPASAPTTQAARTTVIDVSGGVTVTTTGAAPTGTAAPPPIKHYADRNGLPVNP